jgi:hypothetical protein
MFISALKPLFWVYAVIASASNFQNMVKGQLKSGEKMFVVRVEHFVKLRDFSKHLTEYFYERNEDFDNKISKKKAEEILKRGLFFEGLHGSYEDGYFEASFEEGQCWNAIYNMAYDWVKSKYDWLS